MARPMMRRRSAPVLRGVCTIAVSSSVLVAVLRCVAPVAFSMPSLQVAGVGAGSVCFHAAMRGTPLASAPSNRHPLAPGGWPERVDSATARRVWPAPAVQEKKGGIDFMLIAYFFFWYLGNYYYNITNKLALKAAGGASGFPMTIATLQLGVGMIWALFLWGYPDARALPRTTWDDWLKTLPVGFTSAGAHAASVFALSAGAVSFGQIVKAAEPAFAALIGTLFYSSQVSLAKWLCLIPVIGGVVLASLGEMDFAWAALITAAIANVFAAIKGNENKKLMTTPGLKDRMGGVGNQFALTTINSFLFCLVLMLITEGRKFGTFVTLATTNRVILMNLIWSGLWFYVYNELATMTIKKTSAVTQSVANTAKRVIVIVGVAIVMGESLDKMKLIGCGIGIGGVFLYSVIDDIIKRLRS